MPDPVREFARFAERGDHEINLAEAALVIARTEYPQLDAAAHLARLDRMAAQIDADPTYAPLANIRALNEFLFEKEKFAGNEDAYDDPRNSFLDDVLDRKLGIPIALSLVYSSLYFSGNRKSIAQRDECGEELRRAINQAVEFLDRQRRGVVGSGASGRTPGPQHVVSNEQAPQADTGQSQAKYFRVLRLRHVVEDEVESSFGLFEEPKRIPDQHAHSAEQAGAAKVLFRATRVGRIAVGVIDNTARPDGARQPQRRITDRRAHLEYAPDANQPGELVEQAPAPGADDRDSVARCVPLHLAQHSIARREQRDDVLFSFRFGDSVHACCVGMISNL